MFRTEMFYKPTKIAKIKNTNHTKILKGGGATWLVELKNGTTTLGKSLVVSFCPVIPPKRYKNICPQKNCMRIFLTVLSIIAPNWKQLKCPSTKQWTNKLQYIHTNYTIYAKYCSAIKRGKLLIYTITQLNLQNFIQSKRSFADYDSRIGKTNLRWIKKNQSNDHMAGKN